MMPVNNILLPVLFLLYLLQTLFTGLGVTWCDPDKMSTLPQNTYDLPQSCLMWGSLLYKNGYHVSRLPFLYVSPGDDVSIKHTNNQLQFYHSKQLFYTWDIEIPTPVWGYVGLKNMNKISIEGEKDYFICQVLTMKINKIRKQWGMCIALCGLI